MGGLVSAILWVVRLTSAILWVVSLTIAILWVVSLNAAILWVVSLTSAIRGHGQPDSDLSHTATSIMVGLPGLSHT